jgi:hypothetical protein
METAYQPPLHTIVYKQMRSPVSYKTFFWKTNGAAYALFPHILACLFTPMLIGIELMQTRILYIQAYEDVFNPKKCPKTMRHRSIKYEP